MLWINLRVVNASKVSEFYNDIGDSYSVIIRWGKAKSTPKWSRESRLAPRRITLGQNGFHYRMFLAEPNESSLPLLSLKFIIDLDSVSNASLV